MDEGVCEHRGAGALSVSTRDAYASRVLAHYIAEVICAGYYGNAESLCGAVFGVVLGDGYRIYEQIIALDVTLVVGVADPCPLALEHTGKGAFASVRAAYLISLLVRYMSERGHADAAYTDKEYFFALTEQLTYFFGTEPRVLYRHLLLLNYI